MDNGLIELCIVVLSAASGRIFEMGCWVEQLRAKEAWFDQAVLNTRPRAIARMAALEEL